MSDILISHDGKMSDTRSLDRAYSTMSNHSTAPDERLPTDASRIINVDRLAATYGRFVATTRLWRYVILCALTQLLLTPAALVFTSNNTTLSDVLIGEFLIVVVLCLVVWAVSALSRGSRTAAAVLFLLICVNVTASVILDVRRVAVGLSLLEGVYRLIHFFCLVLLAVGPGRGLIELMHLDDASRSICVEPHTASQLRRAAESVFGIPDALPFVRKRGVVALTLVLLGTAIEMVVANYVVGLLLPVDRTRFLIRMFRHSEEIGIADVSAILLLVQLPIWIAICAAIGATLLNAAEWLRRAGRGRVVQSATEALSMDSRAPILFLRAFADEQVSFAGARMPCTCERSARSIRLLKKCFSTSSAMLDR